MRIALALMAMMTAGCSVLLAPEHYDDESGEIRDEEPSASNVAKKPSATKTAVVTEDGGADAGTEAAAASPPLPDASTTSTTTADAAASACADGFVECRTLLTKELRCERPEHTCLVLGEVVCSLL